MAAADQRVVLTGIEREQARRQRQLAIIGSAAQRLARECGHSSWLSFETAFRAGHVTPPAKPHVSVQMPAIDERPAPVPLPSAVRAEHEAREYAMKRGVDLGLVAAFCGGKGTGRFGHLSIGDVRRYMDEADEPDA